jgi:cell shape-determining protein MreC
MINSWNIFRSQPTPAQIRAEIKNATTPVFKKIEEGIDELGAELVALRKENKELKRALKIYESNTESTLVLTNEVTTNGH